MGLNGPRVNGAGLNDKHAEGGGAGVRPLSAMASETELLGLGLLTIGVNVALMVVKITVGILGNSYALVADGLESAGDTVSSLITWSGYQLSLKPADAEHPYGHGKIESLAAIFSGLSLLGAAGFIAYSAIREILVPHHAPAWFTLPVLLLVVLVKMVLARWVLGAAHASGSTAIKGDAWHHQADALTSAAAAVGIAVALIGGAGYESADDWAALLACGVIVLNGGMILRTALHDLLDGNVGTALLETVQTMAQAVPGVASIEKVRLRKSGPMLFAEMHLRVQATLTVREGHAISHAVKDQLMAHIPHLRDVLIHLEPEREG